MPQFPRSLFNQSRKIKFAADTLILAVAIPFAFILRLEGEVLTHSGSIGVLLLIAVPMHIVITQRLGYHRQSWTNIGLHDIRTLLMGVAALTTSLFLIAWWVQSLIPMPRSVPIITGVLALLGHGGIRFLARGWSEYDGRAGNPDHDRVLIVGANDPGVAVAKQLQNTGVTAYSPVGFLDDDGEKSDMTFAGLPVLGAASELPRIVEDEQIDEVLYASSDNAPGHRREVFELAEEAAVPARPIPDVVDLLENGSKVQMHDTVQSMISHGTPRNILIIGGAGYIGSALVPKLLAEGYRVRVLDKLIYGDDAIEEYLDHPNFELIEGDFRQIDDVLTAVQGMDAVVHLGAIVGDPASALDEEITVEVNLMATKMIAEVVKGYGINRFIFASTCSVYGATEGDEYITESSRLNPVSLYAETKVESEQVLEEMAGEQFQPTLLRFGTVYGFSGRTRFDLVVNLLTAKAAFDNEITLYGGDQWRPFVHVEDVANSIRIALETPLDVVGNEVFNVGSDEQNYQIVDVAHHINDHIPEADIVQVSDEHDGRNYRVNFDKIRSELEFRPNWTLDDGIEQVIEAIESDEVTDYTEPTHSNIKYLSEQGVEEVVRAEFHELWSAALSKQEQLVETTEH